ncbi:MAG: DUF4410 domain-containing protein [Myxococcota bacterium]
MTRTATIRLLLALALPAAVGCTSTKVSNRDEYTGGKLPKPGRLIVHNFAATPADLPDWYETTHEMNVAAAEMKPEDLEKGRDLGIHVARELVKELVDMGMPAVRSPGQRPPDEGDLVLVGYFGTIDQGSAMKRVLIGFGSGGADVTTHVDGFRMTDGSLERLGGGDLDAGDNKGPGMVVPTIVTIATANPVGLVVGGAVKAAGELSGSSTVEGSGKRTAKKIADVLEPKFQEQGWID